MVKPVNAKRFKTPYRAVYCGPLALASLAGIAPATAEEEFRKLLYPRRKRKVVGVRLNDLLTLLKRRGLVCQPLPLEGKPTILTHVRATPDLSTSVLYRVSGHFLVRANRTIIDTFRPQGRDAASHPKRLCRVTSAYLVYRAKNTAKKEAE